MSISTTSGRSRRGELDGLLAVGGLADDLHVAGRLEHGAEAGAHQRLVVGDQRAAAAGSQRQHRAHGVAAPVAPPARLERPAEQRDALAHADEAVARPAAGAGCAAPSSITESSSASVA